MPNLKKLSNQELIEILEGDGDDNPDDNNDATDFIYAMKFEPGKRKMEFSVIYTLYKIWSDEPVNRWALGRELSKRFVRRRDRYSVYYLMKRVPKRGLGRRY